MAETIKSDRPYQRVFFHEWRMHSGLSQDKAVMKCAEYMQISKATISRLEKGTQAYTQDILEGLAHAYGCSPADLLVAPPSASGSILAIWDKMSEDTRRTAVEQCRSLLESQIRRLSPDFVQQGDLSIDFGGTPMAGRAAPPGKKR